MGQTIISLNGSILSPFAKDIILQLFKQPCCVYYESQHFSTISTSFLFIITATIMSMLLFFFLVSSFVLTSSTNPMPALLALKSSFQHSNPQIFSSWLPTNKICSFAGITCSHSGIVTEIDLSNKGLSGSLPFDSICSIPSLWKLGFGSNFLSGRVSANISLCTQLRYLDLGNNQFSGPFPDISSLSHLKYLYLHLNGFSGAFPWNSLTHSLLELTVGDNPFTKSPFPIQVTTFKHLNFLYLSNCSLYGPIPPEIGNLSRLVDLELSHNSFSGSIPQEISKLKNLAQLEVYNNYLTGRLPVGFRNLSRLEGLDASSNSLEGDLSELRFLDKLNLVHLYNNEFSGEVPAEFGEFRKLVNLSLYNNKLTGSLPPKLGSWAEFNIVDLSSNRFSGPIPPDMCKKQAMTDLLIMDNTFSGDIPANYANCSTLTRFRVSQNSLTGEVPPGIWGLPNLNIIDIAYNQLRGPISPLISTAGKLSQIFASNNRLSGNIPEEIGGGSSLVLVDFRDNQLSGKIPESIGELKELTSLLLENNQLSGMIPDTLRECKSITELNLGANLFWGSVPTFLGCLPRLTFLNLSHNRLSGMIPGTCSFPVLREIDFSYNNLSGPVPDSLCVVASNASLVGNDGLENRCSSKSSLVRPKPPNPLNYHILVYLLGASLAIVVLGGCYLYLKIRAASKKRKDLSLSLKEAYSWDMKAYRELNFTHEQVLDGIKHDNVIGKGGSGTVYKVTLRDGKELAVKHVRTCDSKSDRKSRTVRPVFDSQGAKNSRAKQFDMEVQTLSTIRHINIVKLYCSITSKDSSLLVYEYLPNGSLWDRLQRNEGVILDWKTRYEIALGTARGLEYLHHWYEKRVVHSDIKSSNILLDEFFRPKIGDFGIATILQTGVDWEPHVFAGTYGYMAPEYGRRCTVNEKCDVYSFCVVLMELVTRRKPIETDFGEHATIVSWVSSKEDDKESLMAVIDSSIPQAAREQALKVLEVAIFCTASLPEGRPTMRLVVQKLEEESMVVNVPPEGDEIV